MAYMRYSAAEMFGVPLDGSAKPNDPEVILQVQTRGLELMEAYGIEPQEVPTDPTDITPYYWQENNWRYFVSQDLDKGLAKVELLPARGNPSLHSSQEDFRGLKEGGAGTPQRTFTLPHDADWFPLVGGSPRFAGKLCLHELIVPER